MERSENHFFLPSHPLALTFLHHQSYSVRFVRNWSNPGRQRLPVYERCRILQLHVIRNEIDMMCYSVRNIPLQAPVMQVFVSE